MAAMAINKNINLKKMKQNKISSIVVRLTFFRFREIDICKKSFSIIGRWCVAAAAAQLCSDHPPLPLFQCAPKIDQTYPHPLPPFSEMDQ
jgi:hypothetical protein